MNGRHSLGRGSIMLLLLGLGTMRASGSDPWEPLAEVRADLLAGSQSADFTQTYLPAGFSSGERESGKLFLKLPECLRWDYELPYPRTFLVCGQILHTWNLGDPSGRRQLLELGDEAGLELLRLELDELRQRYEVDLQERGDDRLDLVLTPYRSSFELVEARLTVHQPTRRLIGIEYRDAEGNVTRFAISAYQPLEENDRFQPPLDLDWLEE